MRHLPSPRALLILIALLPAAACQKDEITVQRVPKETAEPLAGAPAAGSHREAEWNVPPGWKEQAPTAMRVGSFLATGSNGKSVDISVVPLAGEAGGELANINRWRGQLNLPPVDEAGLSSIAKSASVGAHAARLVEFSDGGKRLLAAVLKQGHTSWFFKAIGDDKAVKDIKPAFLAFVESVHFHDHE